MQQRHSQVIINPQQPTNPLQQFPALNTVNTVNTVAGGTSTRPVSKVTIN